MNMPTGKMIHYFGHVPESLSECFYNKDGKWYYAGTYKAFRMDDLTVQEWESLSTEVISLSSPRPGLVDTAVFVDDSSNREGNFGRSEERVASKSLRNIPALCRGGIARCLHRSALCWFQRRHVSWCARTITVPLLGTKLCMGTCQDDDHARRND